MVLIPDVIRFVSKALRVHSTLVCVAGISLQRTILIGQFSLDLRRPMTLDPKQITLQVKVGSGRSASCYKLTGMTL